MTGSNRVILGPSSFASVDPSPVERLKAAGLEVVANPYGRKLTKEEMLGLLPGAVGLIAGLERLNGEVLEHSTLKVISRCGAGLSNIDLHVARVLGIEVRSTPDAPTVAVAELTVGTMLALLREVPRMDLDLREGRWLRRIGAQVAGKTIVIIGFGRIGQRVAKLLRPFGATLLAVDPAVTAPIEGVDLVPLGSALEQADIISLHASGETELLGEREFARMKRGVYLLNPSRGGLVDEAVLCKALESGRVAGAWLDTFKQEPYEGPLTRFRQVILTPHAGSATAECRRRMEMEAVENLLDVLGSTGGGR